MYQTPLRRFIFFGAILLFWIVLDLSTKQYVFQMLPSEHESITLLDGYVRLTHLKNRGAVWGILQSFNQVLFVFHLLVVPFLFLFFVWSLYKPGFLVERINTIFVVATGLVMGGAIGNLYDRLCWGYVRDFIDVTIPIINYRWPVFNVADSGITVGALMLAFCILWYPPEPEDEKSRTSERD